MSEDNFIPTLNTNDFFSAVKNSPAIRSITSLQPAAGVGTKIFPASYIQEEGRPTKYAIETQATPDGPVNCCLVDSVASQANRREQALLSAARCGRIPFPYIEVDFSNTELDLPSLTTLDLPHRCADAILRDSVLNDTPFRESEIGMRMRSARTTNASAILAHDPISLLHGFWDSTDLRSKRGSKFARCVSGEIMARNVQVGVKPGSRIDPLEIGKEIPIYEHKDDPTRWTVDESLARIEKKKPVRYRRHGKSSDGAGKAASINHGNIPPNLDTVAGGITCLQIVQNTVLSLTALRRLAFRDTLSGNPVPAEHRHVANLAAQGILAALGIASIVFDYYEGYDLRSGCCLVPEHPLRLEVLSSYGDEPGVYTLDREGAVKLVKEALDCARDYGMGWDADVEPLIVSPSGELEALTRLSHESVDGENRK